MKHGEKPEKFTDMCCTRWHTFCPLLSTHLQAVAPTPAGSRICCWDRSKRLAWESPVSLRCWASSQELGHQQEHGVWEGGIYTLATPSTSYHCVFFERTEKESSNKLPCYQACLFHPAAQTAMVNLKMKF